MFNRIMALMIVTMVVAVLAATSVPTHGQPTASPLTGLGRFSNTPKWKGSFTLSGSGGGQSTTDSWTVSQSANGTFTLASSDPGAGGSNWAGEYKALVSVRDSTVEFEGPQGTPVNVLTQGSGTVTDEVFLDISVNEDSCIYDLQGLMTDIPVTRTINGNSIPSSYGWGPIGLGLGIEDVPLPASGGTLSGSRQFRGRAQDSFGDNDWNVTWTLQCDTEGNLPVRPLKQNDPAWSKDLYDHTSKRTIGGLGCALTSLTMALNFIAEGPAYTPGSLNSVMTRAGGFNGAGVVFPVATHKASNGGMKFHALRSSSTSVVDEILCMGFPVIVGVELKLNARGQLVPGHYIVVTGRLGTEVVISDTFYNRTKLSDYPSFQTRGFVTKASWNANPTQCGAGGVTQSRASATVAGDKSALTISADNNVELLVVDPNGRRTGHEISTGDLLEEIPESVYFIDSLKNDETGEPPDEIAHLVHMEHPAQGSYQITVTGVQQGPYSVAIQPFSQDGSLQTPTIIQGTAPVGSSSIQFQYNPTGADVGGDGVTIVGTSGKDTLVGTPGRDRILGLGGNDTINGLGGNDVIDGGPGKDVIMGGSGKDKLNGGGGTDRCKGGSGRDTARSCERVSGVP